MDAQAIVDYAASLDCIHCGMCVSSCPTWKITGVESSSPRGRIHLMRAVAEGELEPDADYVEEMEFCLLCRHCESVCPSGVRFGEMMEFARDGITREVGRPIGARLLRWIGFRVLLPHRFLLRAAAFLARIVAPVLGTPAIPPARERRPLPERTAALADRRGSLAVLEGCVMPLLFGRVNRATVDVLARCGFEVVSPAGQTCCGSLHAHNCDLDCATPRPVADRRASTRSSDRGRAPRCSSRRSRRCARAERRRSSPRTRVARCSGKPASRARACPCAWLTSPRSCAKLSSASGRCGRASRTPGSRRPRCARRP